MHVEERNLSQVVEKAELLVACYTVIESAVSYMANDRFHMIESRQKGQLYSALKNAFGAVVKFLQEAGKELKEDSKQLEDATTR